jgi:hypothetical protein
VDFIHEILPDVKNIERGGGHLFGNVVVRARIQALDAVLHLRPLGQHQHRQTGLFQPQMPQHADPIQLGQVQIENDHVILRLGGGGARQFASEKTSTE